MTSSSTKGDEGGLDRALPLRDRATRASHRARAGLGHSAGIASAIIGTSLVLSGCSEGSPHHYAPPMICSNEAEGGLVSLEPYFHWGELNSYRYRDRYGVERYAPAPLGKGWVCPAQAIGAGANDASE